jgi:hypothetical protein
VLCCALSLLLQDEIGQGGGVMRRSITAVFVLALTIGACGDETESVSVSGIAPCVEVAPEGEELNRYECVETVDDDRVSGTSTVTVTALDDSVSPIEIEGTETLINDGGSWSGDWSGVIEDDGTHVAEGVLIGSGEYDRQQYRVRYVFTTLSNIEVSGTIESAP